MAVTFFQQPTTSTIQASDTPIIYVFSGSNYLQPNFCFIVETLIDNAVVSTDMIFPEVGSRGHIDISQTTLHSFRAAARQTAFTVLQNFSTAYIRVAERFGTTPVTGVFYNSNVCKIMKASCDDDKFQANWITINYPPSSKWLTDVPENTYLVSRTNPAWFSILNADANIIVGLTITEANGTVTLHSEPSVPGADRVNFCISETSLGPILSLYPSVVWDNIVMIEVQMNVADSMYVKFVDADCELNQQINWLNNLGAYDQMLFSHNREVKRQITTQDYEKQFGNWSGNSFVHDKLNSGDTEYVKEITPVGSLYTGWLSESYRNWLNQITESIDKLLITNGVYEKISVTNTNSEELQTHFEEIMNYQIDYRKTSYKSITH